MATFIVVVVIIIAVDAAVVVVAVVVAVNVPDNIYIFVLKGQQMSFCS